MAHTKTHRKQDRLIRFHVEPNVHLIYLWYMHTNCFNNIYIFRILVAIISHFKNLLYKLTIFREFFAFHKSQFGKIQIHNLGTTQQNIQLDLWNSISKSHLPTAHCSDRCIFAV